MPDLLSAVIFLPAIGALLLAFLPKEEETNLKAAAIAITLATFCLSLGLLMRFDLRSSAMQLGVSAEWIPSFGIRYQTGLDGVSLPLVLLTTFLMPVTLLGAWSSITTRVREFVIAMCALESGMLGAFAALDLFLFYVFWEAMLIPMYLLIGIWGGKRRIFAAVKFFLFTFAGSILMLVAILYVAQQANGSWDFSLDAALKQSFAASTQKWLFAAFALAFAIKVPMFPVHTWLPDAHTEAPTPGSVILAGVLLKLGVYGFIRFAYPLFPQAALDASPLIAWLAVAGIMYGAVAAWVQPDMKKLVAYSSVSHLGFCVLGVTAMTVEGVSGSVYQMVAHGLSTGGLFLLVGVLYERRHTRLLADYGGIARKVPTFTFFFVFTALASAGLPALSGFPGEFLILLGTFTSGFPLNAQVAIPGLGTIQLAHMQTFFAATGVILAAVYLLWMVQKVLFGPLQNPANEKLEDMGLREVVVMLPLVVLMLVLGVAPGRLIDTIQPSAKAFVESVHKRGTGREYKPDFGAKRIASAVPVIGGEIRPQLKVAPNDLRQKLMRGGPVTGGPVTGDGPIRIERVAPSEVPGGGP
ncbi:MAG: NADH-quinone oxidoreductase subunit M [Deltaproteobacteria bacterium]|nr:NADH-quinone oxidoreductase subunit M [Deltaproteobacteria bacterium]